MSPELKLLSKTWQFNSYTVGVINDLLKKGKSLMLERVPGEGSTMFVESLINILNKTFVTKVAGHKEMVNLEDETLGADIVLVEAAESLSYKEIKLLKGLMDKEKQVILLFSLSFFEDKGFHELPCFYLVRDDKASI